MSLDIIEIKKKRFIEVLVREIVIIIKFIIRFFIILLIQIIDYVFFLIKYI